MRSRLDARRSETGVGRGKKYFTGITPEDWSYRCGQLPATVHQQRMSADGALLCRAHLDVP